MRAATEAVKKLLRRTHGERWRFFGVKRTQPNVVLPALFQLNVAADDVDDVDARKQVLDEALGNHVSPKVYATARRSYSGQGERDRPPAALDEEPGVVHPLQRKLPPILAQLHHLELLVESETAYSAIPPLWNADPSEQLRALRDEVLKQLDFPTNTTAAFMARGLGCGRSIAARLVPARAHRNADADRSVLLPRRADRSQRLSRRQKR